MGNEAKTLDAVLKIQNSVNLFRKKMKIAISTLDNPETSLEEIEAVKGELPKSWEEYGRLHELLEESTSPIRDAYIQQSGLEDLFDSYRVTIEYHKPKQ